MILNKYILSKKYARAFINVYGSIVKNENLEKLNKFKQFLENHKTALFYTQLISANDANNIIKKEYSDLINKFNLDKCFEKLIYLLISQKRIFLLPDVIQSIKKIIKEKLLIEEFTYVTTTELSDSQIQSITEFLSNRLNKNIIYKTKIDKKLIAGIKLYSDNVGFEKSIAQKLEALNKIY